MANNQLTFTQIQDNAINELIKMKETLSIFEYHKDLNKLEDQEILISNFLYTLEMVGLDTKHIENEVSNYLLEESA